MRSDIATMSDEQFDQIVVEGLMRCNQIDQTVSTHEMVHRVASVWRDLGLMRQEYDAEQGDVVIQMHPRLAARIRELDANDR